MSLKLKNWWGVYKWFDCIVLELTHLSGRFSGGWYSLFKLRIITDAGITHGLHLIKPDNKAAVSQISKKSYRIFLNFKKVWLLVGDFLD